MFWAELTAGLARASAIRQSAGQSLRRWLRAHDAQQKFYGDVTEVGPRNASTLAERRSRTRRSTLARRCHDPGIGDSGGTIVLDVQSHNFIISSGARPPIGTE